MSSNDQILKPFFVLTETKDLSFGIFNCFLYFKFHCKINERVNLFLLKPEFICPFHFLIINVLSFSHLITNCISLETRNLIKLDTRNVPLQSGNEKRSHKKLRVNRFIGLFEEITPNNHRQ